MFVTATVATLSGAFAVQMAFSKLEAPGKDMWIIVLSGLVWGFIIFNIDRYMVLGMEGMHRFRVLVPGAIRLLLATLIGIVMATPLVLQIFDSEIQPNIRLVNLSENQKVSDLLKPYEDKVAALKKELDSEQQALEKARSGVNLEQLEVYKDAQDAYQTALAECNTAQNKATLCLLYTSPSPRD